MDEVDGMSGGDRGGVNDLIQSIHRSRVPIICICNDKYNQKLRSLRNHTLELDYRFDSSAYAYACMLKHLCFVLMGPAPVVTLHMSCIQLLKEPCRLQ